MYESTNISIPYCLKPDDVIGVSFSKNILTVNSIWGVIPTPLTEKKIVKKRHILIMGALVTLGMRLKVPTLGIFLTILGTFRAVCLDTSQFFYEGNLPNEKKSA